MLASLVTVIVEALTELECVEYHKSSCPDLDQVTPTQWSCHCCVVFLFCACVVFYYWVSWTLQSVSSCWVCGRKWDVITPLQKCYVYEGTWCVNVSPFDGGQKKNVTDSEKVLCSESLCPGNSVHKWCWLEQPETNNPESPLQFKL